MEWWRMEGASAQARLLLRAAVLVFSFLSLIDDGGWDERGATNVGVDGEWELLGNFA